MKYDEFKMLFDHNSDGSVTYNREDMEILTQEDINEQNFFKAQVMDIS